MSIKLKPMMKLRVFVGSDERCEHRAAYNAILEVIHENGIAGATTTKGIMSYGRGRRTHSDLNEIAIENLPLIIEAVDEQMKIESAAKRIAEMLGERGLVEVHSTARAVGERKERK